MPRVLSGGADDGHCEQTRHQHRNRTIYLTTYLTSKRQFYMKTFSISGVKLCQVKQPSQKSLNGGFQCQKNKWYKLSTNRHKLLL